MSDDLRVSGTGPGTDGLAIRFEGRILSGVPGETLAAALSAAGERVFRRSASGAERGLFCGMGVCQECLVEIDGRPNQRACMTKLEGPISVLRQTDLPLAVEHSTAAGEPVPGSSVLEPDVLVLGAGPGGLNAAIAAARAGARVTVVDERPEPGGQYYKQPVAATGSSAAARDDEQFARGRALIAAARAAGIEMLSGALAWGAFEPLDLMVSYGERSRHFRPKRLIVAAGAYERGVPFPGWTLPGVMTTGAAQTLLRSYRVLVGRRVLVAGNGPLNLQVALELARAGAEIAAIAELAPRPGIAALQPLGAMLAGAPALTLKGLGYLAELRRRRIDVVYNHVVTRVEREGDRLRARLSQWPQDRGGGTDLVVDAVCLGYGFVPANEILRALGCRHDWDASRGQLVTIRDADCLTSVACVYAVGDCTGLGGAPAAEAEGVIAGFAAARSLGLASAPGQERTTRLARARLARQRRLQQGLWSLFGAPRLLTELATPDTVICRCEELTLADLASELALAHSSIGTIKRATRAGMGRCQGRYCGPLLTALQAARQNAPVDESAHWAPRPPVKPVRIADVTR